MIRIFVFFLGFSGAAFAAENITIDRSGSKGRNGNEGRSGRDQRSSWDAVESGENATPAGTGRSGGDIQLRFKLLENGALRMEGSETREFTQPIVSINLSSTGGEGGSGADGGNGGNGAKGEDGVDFTATNPIPTSGRNGGDGGDAGSGSDGGDGGSGGNIDVRIDEKVAYLLKYISANVSGGSGGRAGSHGRAGSAGEGGRAGATSYFDYQKNEYIRSNVMTRSGDRGRPGRTPTFSARSGSSGRSGRVTLQVQLANGEQVTCSNQGRVGFENVEWQEQDPNGVIEKGEKIILKKFRLWAEGPMAVSGVPLRLDLAPSVNFSFPNGFPASPQFPSGRASLDVPVNEAGLEYVYDAGDSMGAWAMLRYPFLNESLNIFQTRILPLIQTTSRPNKKYALQLGDSQTIQFALLNNARTALGEGAPGARAVTIRLKKTMSSPNVHLKFSPTLNVQEVEPGTWEISVRRLEPGRDGVERDGLPMEISVDPRAGFFERIAFDWTLKVDKFDGSKSSVVLAQDSFEVEAAFGPQAIKYDEDLSSYGLTATFADGRKRTLSQLWITRETNASTAIVQYEQRYFGRNSPEHVISLEKLAPYLAKISSGAQLSSNEMVALFNQVIVPETKTQETDWQLVKVERE